MTKHKGDVQSRAEWERRPSKFLSLNLLTSYDLLFTPPTA